MSRHPDPYLPGASRGENGVEFGLPPLLLPAEWVAEWLPLVRRWRAEHEQLGATAKVSAADPILQRWEYLAALQRRAFAGESADGAATASGGSSAHGREEISAAEAAGMLGRSPQWIGALCRRGELTGRKVGGAWLVEVASVVAYRNRRAA